MQNVKHLIEDMKTKEDQYLANMKEAQFRYIETRDWRKRLEDEVKKYEKATTDEA